jgi:hypothetical protein
MNMLGIFTISLSTTQKEQNPHNVEIRGYKNKKIHLKKKKHIP